MTDVLLDNTVTHTSTGRDTGSNALAAQRTGTMADTSQHGHHGIMHTAHLSTP